MITTPMDDSNLTPEERNERFIRYAVTEFEKSLRIMLRDKTTSHWFDFNGTKDGQTELWSFQITVAPKRMFEQIQKLMGASWRLSDPLPIREEGEAGEKPTGFAPTGDQHS